LSGRVIPSWEIQIAWVDQTGYQPGSDPL